MMDAEVVQEPDFTLNQASRILNDGLADSLDENGDNKKKRTTRLIVDNPTLDLDLYTTNYTGEPRSRTSSVTSVIQHLSVKATQR